MAKKRDNRFLPGVQGRNYHIIRDSDGEIYYLLHKRVAGNNLQLLWKIEPGDYSKYGVNKNSGRQVSNAQLKRYHYFGKVTRLQVHGNDEDFLDAWTEWAHAKFGGTPILKNKELMEIFLMGSLEGWGQDAILGKVKQTRFWQQRTKYQRDWLFDTTKADRRTAMDSYAGKMQDILEQTYGDDWRKYVSNKHVRNMAEKIAGGTLGIYGNPADGLEEWTRKHRNRAEKIEGSPAWLAEAEEDRQLNAWEDIREDFRQRGVQWLGYRGLPSNDVLEQWAKAVFGGKKTDADFMNYLRTQKQALFPYLDPEERWMDGAAPYKNSLEQLVGAGVSWKHKMLQDLQGTKADGSPIEKTRMSLFDFEKGVRKSDEYWRGPVAKEQFGGLGDFILKNLGKVA